jgi:glyoxylase-like metal-dependent hydrolase (beta-lactamase superfamily II)
MTPVSNGPDHEHGVLHGREFARDPVTTQAVNEIRVGDRTLLGLSDGFLMMTEGFLGTPEHPTAGYEAMVQEHQPPRMPLGCFFLPGEQNVLIDTGMGPVDDDGQGTLVGGNLLTALARMNVRPDDIDLLVLTHLHGDHSGTIGQLDSGEPTFRNARTFIGSGDWDYFVDKGQARRPLAEHTAQALRQLEASGQITLLDGDTDIAPGVRRLSAPGHTPGHSFYVIHDHGERVLVLGDAFYCPQQLSETEWGALSDVDPPLARQTRERLKRDLEEHGGGAVGCHFPELKVGRALSR